MQWHANIKHIVSWLTTNYKVCKVSATDRAAQYAFWAQNEHKQPEKPRNRIKKIV